MRMIQCDECKKPLPESGMVDWIKTERMGIDARMYSDKPIIGEFCSDDCVVEYFRKRRGEKS